MKPPLSYYGGKQKMLKHLLPLVPPHEIYVEPFAGGAALFFAKKPAKVEVLNDTNDLLITFYRVMKTDFEALNTLIQGTLHSESDYRKAADIYRNPEGVDAVWVAWAVWVQTSISFSSQPLNGFALSKHWSGKATSGKKDEALHTLNKKGRIKDAGKRLEMAVFPCRDAMDLPEIYNTPETFTYYDPPYYNSDCGHYKGFTEKDYIETLLHASRRKGKFLLSSYPSRPLRIACEVFEWNYREIKQTLSVDGRRKETKYKVEALAWNYDEKTMGMVGRKPEEIKAGDPLTIFDHV